jgi:hypothetical protein
VRRRRPGRARAPPDRAAAAQVKASLAEDAESVRELRKWNDKYGEGRKRRQVLIGFDSVVPAVAH